MRIGYLRLRLHLAGARTLKERRGVVNRFLTRARQRLNASVMEADRHAPVDECEVAAVFLLPSGTDPSAIADRIERLALESGAVDVVDRSLSVIDA